MDNFTHYWLAQKNLASKGQGSDFQSTPKTTPQQNSKCIQAWEEYTKLNLAHDDLRREYLALRAEQLDFSNVPKDWLGKVREFRKTCLSFSLEKKSFFNNFYGMCNSKEFAKIKLENLQNKIKNNKELDQKDLRFLYGIDRWPRSEIADVLLKIKEKRDKRKDLSKIFDCEEDQISFPPKETEYGYIPFHDYEFLHRKDMVCHYGNLEFYKGARVANLPKYVIGDVTMDDCFKGLNIRDLVLPEKITKSLILDGLIRADGLILPKEIGFCLHFSDLISAEGLDFSKCQVGFIIGLPKVSETEKDKLRAKYPHLGGRIK